MKDIFDASPGTLGLSQRISIASLRNLVGREPGAPTGTDTTYRKQALEQALAGVEEVGNSYGHLRHLPSLKHKRDWDECAYEVTLKWVGDANSGYSVHLGVTNPVQVREPAKVSNLPWMPCVALVENNGQVLRKMLKAFGVNERDDVVSELVTVLKRLGFPDDGDRPSVTVKDFVVGTSDTLTDPRSVEEKVKGFSHFSPFGNTNARTLTPNGEGVGFTLHTCPLLAATVWPLVYELGDDAGDGDGGAMSCAIEDYGDEAIAHSLSMSQRSEWMADARFKDDDKRVTTLTCCAVAGTHLLTLLHSVVHGDARRCTAWYTWPCTIPLTVPCPQPPLLLVLESAASKVADPTPTASLSLWPSQAAGGQPPQVLGAARCGRDQQGAHRHCTGRGQRGGTLLRGLRLRARPRLATRPVACDCGPRGQRAELGDQGPAPLPHRLRVAAAPDHRPHATPACAPAGL